MVFSNPWNVSAFFDIGTNLNESHRNFCNSWLPLFLACFLPLFSCILALVFRAYCRAIYLPVEIFIREYRHV